MRNRLKKAVALAMAVSMLGGCAGQGTRETGTDPAGTEQAVDMETVPSAGQTEPGTEDAAEVSSESGEQQSPLYAGSRPQLIQSSLQGGGLSVTPSVAPYTVDADLGNVENLWQLYALQYDQEIAEKLAKCAAAPGRSFLRSMKITGMR